MKWIEAARAGDLDSFGKLCEQYYAPMVAVAYSVLRDHQQQIDAFRSQMTAGDAGASASSLLRRIVLARISKLAVAAALIILAVVVFDVDLPGSSEWVRIWALRASRLPVRIRTWNPMEGATTDAVFEYSKGQADEFFDPNAFAAALQSNSASSRANIAYAFLQDPGGKSITPEEMFAGSGYHMPRVEQFGVTFTEETRTVKTYLVRRRP